MYIDEEKIKKVGTYSAAGAAAALVLSLFISPVGLLVAEALAVGGAAYAYNKHRKDTENNSGDDNNEQEKE